VQLVAQDPGQADAVDPAQRDRPAHRRRRARPQRPQLVAEPRLPERRAHHQLHPGGPQRSVAARALARRRRPRRQLIVGEVGGQRGDQRGRPPVDQSRRDLDDQAALGGCDGGRGRKRAGNEPSKQEATHQIHSRNP
jgi:hypothetical protein